MHIELPSFTIEVSSLSKDEQICYIKASEDFILSWPANAECNLSPKLSKSLTEERSGYANLTQRCRNFQRHLPFTNLGYFCQGRSWLPFGRAI
jgi:hypothetical protein